MTGVVEAPVDEDVVDAAMTASRALVGIAARSMSSAGADITLAQYRTLVVLASRGPQRIADLACFLGVQPSTAGRMCDRLVRKAYVRRYRARDDRRVVRVSITPAGRDVVDEATRLRRESVTGVLAAVPADRHAAIAEILRLLAAAAGEVSDDQWPRVAQVSTCTT